MDEKEALKKIIQGKLQADFLCKSNILSKMKMLDHLIYIELFNAISQSKEFFNAISQSKDTQK